MRSKEFQKKKISDCSFFFALSDNVKYNNRVTNNNNRRTTMTKYTQQNKQSLENNKKALVDYVISQLESGTSWQKCWDGAGGLPFSTSTGKRYKGGNCFYLAYTAAVNGYTSAEWGTFKAWKDQGGMVMKGQKGTKIIFFKPIIKENDQGEKEVFFTIKAYTVFNRCQVANLPEIQMLPARFCDCKKKKKKKKKKIKYFIRK